MPSPNDDNYNDSNCDSNYSNDNDILQAKCNTVLFHN